ncbi:hypothetical protein [Streptomyces sp. NPDC001678]|uniref:hypothetical protein n=1 Tax=Streptomyces sp. NPDC001678 TaxID=3364599 RepID=UPI0036810DF1
MQELGRRWRLLAEGAGIAGLLCAHVLTRAYDHVVLVERDLLPDAPVHRPGVPQSRHVHGLLDRGLRDIEHLVPGFTTDLLQHGAGLVDFAADIALRTPAGWLPRVPSCLRSCTASRPLVETAIRRRVLSHARSSCTSATWPTA